MSMEENPYAAPRATDTAIGVRSGKRADLRSVAVYQKGLLISLGLYLLFAAMMIVAQFAFGREVPPAFAIAAGIVGLAGALGGITFTFLLSMKVYGVVIGLFLAFFAFVPCVGLLVLLAMSTRATNILRQNGIPVGFLGADLSRIELRNASDPAAPLGEPGA